ncbi:MAG: hypothetical protein ACI4D3_14760 [Lachnospiraceae bacterium]
MDGKHPNRKKDKQNPYTLSIENGKEYIKVYDEQEPDEEQREAFSDSYGTMYMQPVMISYNQKYAPRVISAQAGFQVVGRIL